MFKPCFLFDQIDFFKAYESQDLSASLRILIHTVENSVENLELLKEN